MGFLSMVSGKNRTSLVGATQATRLDAKSVMANQKGAVTAENPGSWEHLGLTLPDKARQFNAAEAQQMTQQAAQVRAQVSTTRTALKAAREISKDYSEANKEYEITRRAFATDTVQNTLQRAQSGVLLQGTRPVIAKAQSRLQMAAAEAEGAIAAMG